MKTSQKQFIPLYAAALIGISFSYLSLSTRIYKTGWESFPETLLDWFSIISAIGILSFLSYLLILYLQENKRKDR